MSAEKCPVCGCDETWKAHGKTHYECGFSPDSHIRSLCEHSTRLAIERAAEVERLRCALAEIAHIDDGVIYGDERESEIQCRLTSAVDIAECALKKPEKQP